MFLAESRPVTSVNGFVNVHNPLSGGSYGKLQVCVAVGTLDQISNLKASLRGSEPVPTIGESEIVWTPNKPKKSSGGMASTTSLEKHCFEVTVQGLSKLKWFEDVYTTAEELSVFVSYRFPGSTSETSTSSLPCATQVSFNETNKHEVYLSPGQDWDVFFANGGVDAIQFSVLQRGRYKVVP